MNSADFASESVGLIDRIVILQSELLARSRSDSPLGRRGVRMRPGQADAEQRQGIATENQLARPGMAVGRDDPEY